jgi:hypothetical protein
MPAPEFAALLEALFKAWFGHTRVPDKTNGVQKRFARTH